MIFFSLRYNDKTAMNIKQVTELFKEKITTSDRFSQLNKVISWNHMSYSSEGFGIALRNAHVMITCTCI